MACQRPSAFPRTQIDDNPTETSYMQSGCEEDCISHLEALYSNNAAMFDAMYNSGILGKDREIYLLRMQHMMYSRRGLQGLSGGYQCLDASRPWIVYWILQSLDLLGSSPGGVTAARVVSFLSRCQNTTSGGFGGGPGQLPHCAPTYAAVLSLLIVGTEDAYAAIDRRALYRFFMSMRYVHSSDNESADNDKGHDRNGASDGGAHGVGVRMHDDGELDVRAVYTCVAVAALTGILTPQLARGLARWVGRCQTYEGGFGGEPGTEAHGGYAFCALAALVILGEASSAADLPAVARWVVGRQMRGEGGFQGRTNKLVDGCYSFWQGAIPSVLALANPALFTTPPPATAAAPVETAQPPSPPQLDTTPPPAAACPVSGAGAAATAAATCPFSAASTTAAAATVEGGAASEGTEAAASADGGMAAAMAALTRRVVGPGATRGGSLLCDEPRLQQYVLACCQISHGGLRDKPGKGRDFYHTCYTLSGLSASQHSSAPQPTTTPSPSLILGVDCSAEADAASADSAVVEGSSRNLLARTHPLFNIRTSKVAAAYAHFSALPTGHDFLMSTGPAPPPPAAATPAALPAQAELD